MVKCQTSWVSFATQSTTFSCFIFSHPNTHFFASLCHFFDVFGPYTAIIFLVPEFAISTLCRRVFVCHKNSGYLFVALHRKVGRWPVDRIPEGHRLRGRIAEYPSIPQATKCQNAQRIGNEPHAALLIDDLPALESDLSSVKPRPFINGH